MLKLRSVSLQLLLFFFSRMFGYPGSLAFLCGLELAEGRKEARGEMEGGTEGGREEKSQLGIQ